VRDGCYVYCQLKVEGFSNSDMEQGISDGFNTYKDAVQIQCSISRVPRDGKDALCSGTAFYNITGETLESIRSFFLVGN
jgi:hypothetical protein